MHTPVSIEEKNKWLSELLKDKYRYKIQKQKEKLKKLSRKGKGLNNILNF